MTNMIVVLVTTSSQDEAKKIAQALLEEKLIACVNIVEGVCSMFKWQGTVCNEDESLMIIKSIATHYHKIEEKIKNLHSYEVPEIIILPIAGGSEEYLNWVEQETQSESN